MVVGFFSTALWVLLEPILLTQFQTTPGKALFGLKLISTEGHPNYWKRSFAVWAVGVGFGLPFISLFAILIASNRMTLDGITDWDRWACSKVDAETLGVNKAIVIALLISLIVGNRIVLLSGSSMKAPQTDKKFLKLQKEAEGGVAVAQFNLALAYSNGEGAPKDTVKAIEWYYKAAEQGDSTAQNNLGLIYSNGEGVPKDAIKAVAWFQKSAAQGLAIAQYNLGVQYEHGEGVPNDNVKAVEWYRKAAEQGNANAQNNLGSMYTWGKGVLKDDVMAFEWYQKAAAQGLDIAQCNLGSAYGNGAGVPKDAIKAVEWYRKAAEQGFANAQNNLGYAYANGEGVSKDDVKAFKWYLKAATQGLAVAQLNLGRAYTQGKNKDWVSAYAWFNLAAAQGDTDAQTVRDIVEKILTDNQRMEGQRLASNWKPGDTLIARSADRFNQSDKTTTNGKPRIQHTGTAFTVSHQGHALTNYHLINGCTEVIVAGREGVAKVITSDSVNDLALLKITDKSDSYAKLNPDPGKLRQGEDIVVFGYPLNFALSSGGNLTPGTLSALTGLGNNTNQIQITAPVQPGSSGSPVMDKKGNVVAVVSMSLDDGKISKLTGQVGQNVNFAVNGQTVKAFLDTNNVPYETGGGFFSSEQSNVDIAEEARKWTVLLECWK
jgi:TPR repeat protein